MNIAFSIIKDCGEFKFALRINFLILSLLRRFFCAKNPKTYKEEKLWKPHIFSIPA
jgi:hypothetical protein